MFPPLACGTRIIPGKLNWYYVSWWSVIDCKNCCCPCLYSSQQLTAVQCRGVIYEMSLQSHVSYLNPYYKHGLTLIPALVTTCPVKWRMKFPNCNGTTVNVWEWISNFISHLLVDVITYPCWKYISPILIKGPDISPHTRLYMWNGSCESIWLLHNLHNPLLITSAFDGDWRRNPYWQRCWRTQQQSHFG